MGWDFIFGATKQDIINDVTATWKSSETGTEHTCIAKRCVGNHLWTVWATDNDSDNYTVKIDVNHAMIMPIKNKW